MPTIIGRISAFLWGIKVIESGRENFDESTQYIFVGNHRSFLDAIISGGFIYNYKKFIGKAEILKWPFMGFILKRLYIPVKREDKDSRKKSMEQLIEKMKEGYSMVVFSEGKSNTTDEPLLPFKDGAYTTSCETKIPIVPFVMYGADHLWPRKQILIRPGKIYLDFLPVAEPLEPTEENIQKQKELVFHNMLRKYKEREACY
jgi:1-acyl-sn-glycerol-3-phosphate acyltransferase